MRKPESVLTIPRESNELAVDVSKVAELARAQVSKLCGVVFPTKDYGSPGFAMSEPLGSVPFDANTRRILEEDGCRIQNLTSVVRISKDHTYWDFDLIGKKLRVHVFEFEVCLSLPEQDREFSFKKTHSQVEDTLRLALETRPRAGGGSHGASVHLANLFEKGGYTLPPFVKELRDAGGLLEPTWDEIGIEPNVSMKKFFMDFRDSFEQDGKNPVGDFVDHLARQVELSPLDPAPFYRSTSSFDGGGRMLLDTQMQVPSSCQKALREQWLEQLHAFKEARFPHR